MGVRLMVEMLDSLPPDTTPAERLVLVALAERTHEHTSKCPADCRRPTRRVILGQGEDATQLLIRRTGLTERGLRAAMTRLAARGLDPRVPLGMDHRGRPLFAHQGRSRDYVLPLTQGDATMPPPVDEGGTVMPPPVDEGGTVVPSGGTVVPPGGTVVPPLYLHPSGPNSSSTREPRSSNAAELARTILLLLDPKLPEGMHLDPAAVEQHAARLDRLGWTPRALAGRLDTFDLRGARTAGLAVTKLRDLKAPPRVRVTAPRPGPKCAHDKPYGDDGTSAGCCPDQDPKALATSARAS